MDETATNCVEIAARIPAVMFLVLVLIGVIFTARVYRVRLREAFLITVGWRAHQSTKVGLLCVLAIYVPTALVFFMGFQACQG